MSSNLKQRGLAWFVRVKVNPKYSKLIGRTETVRSLKTRDKAVAEGMKHGVIQQIKDYHERLIREAQSGMKGQTDDALELRLQVESGELPDDGTAGEILHDRLERRLKDIGLTAEQIEKLTQDDLDPLVRESFAVVNQTNSLPLKAAIKQYLDLIENDVTPRTWQQKERQLEDFSEWTGHILATDVDRRLASRYLNECLVPKGLAPNTNINIVAGLSAFFSWLIDNSLYDNANPFARKSKTLKGRKKGSAYIANRGVLEILCQSYNLEKRGLTNEREIRF